MKTLLKQISWRSYLLGAVFLVATTAYGTPLDEEEAMIEYLQGLDFEDLTEVEVTLDEVFDVFDGLVKKRTVKVATGVEQSTAHAPAVTTVITAQDIEAMGVNNLNQVLEMVPGLHVARSSENYSSLYIIRGVYSDANAQVLLLINGMPIKALFAGNRGMTWAGMPANVIARIEIIRGPGSAVYGADAFGGVINVITKSKDDIDGTEAGIRMESFDTQEAWLLHGDNWAGFDVAMALEYGSTDGHGAQIEADAQTQFDHIFGTQASLAPGPVNLQHDHFDAHLDISRDVWQWRADYQKLSDFGTAVGITQALDPSGKYAGERLNTDLTYHNLDFTENWDVTAQLSYLAMTIETSTPIGLFPPGAFGGAYPYGQISYLKMSERHTRLDLSAFYSGFKKHDIRLGTGYYYGEINEVVSRANYGINPATGQAIPPGTELIDVSDSPYAFIPEKDRKSWYLFVQDVWLFAPNWELTAGLRYDEYSDFGSTLNPRFALVWDTRPDFTSKFLYGRAFRAPAFGELYSISNPVALGNPDLEPEIIDSWELAFDYRATDNLHMALNLFSYKWYDAIHFVANPGGQTRTAQNAGSQTGHGLEFETRWKMTKKASLLANYAYQESRDEEDHDAGNAPQHQAYLRTDWLVYPNWYLDTQINWVGKRHRIFADPRASLDGYTTVDLTLRRKDIRKGHWNFALGVRNLFDDDAREPSRGPTSRGIVSIPNDLPLAGRHFFLEMRYQF
ncbi:MAG: TonB-dependent receptor [Pseudomonadota bacterium]